MDPTVAVVVPTFNRAASLRRLLAALLTIDQPAGGVDIVVVDDGSTDDTPAVVSQFENVGYLHQANRGPAAARNLGWRRASADVIAFIDDDCVPEERWLVDLQRAFDADPTVSGVGGAIRSRGTSFVDRFISAERLVDHGRDAQGVRFLVTANAAYRRIALASVDGFDEGLRRAAGEDTDLSYRIRSAGGHLALCETAVVVHDHRTSLRELFATYYRHGQARSRLARRHPQLGLATGARRAARPSDLRERYLRYRSLTNFPGALVYMGLRVLAIGVYLTGTIVERLR